LTSHECNQLLLFRQLFWISDNLLSRSEDEEKFAAVMRSNCDGSEVTKIISKDLHKPRSEI